jgi:ferrous iron transport protein A
VSRLADLAVGSRARLVNVTGDDEISLRLLEMALTPGVDVELLGTAPLGEPLEFDVRGYHLSVRRSEAQRVEIESL